MATWKEKGVVPDSDDEDSALESQSEADLEDYSNELRNNDFHNGHNDVENDNNKEEVKGAVGDERTLAGKELGGERSPSHITESSDNRIRADTATASILPPSSPISPRVFKDPRKYWALGTGTTGLGGAGQSISTEAHDEISQSYVRVTSPMSSILSSLPGSQLSQNTSLQGPGELNNSRPIDNSDSVDKSNAEHIEEPTTFRKRSFRQRNAIQLHPYVLEQEKYRRTLKARGMTPMRLIQSQDQRAKNGRDAMSPEPDSLERDSQDIEFDIGGSQTINIQRNSSPLSSSVKSVSTDDGGSDAFHSTSRDDDDFPDIDELMKGQETFSKRLKAKGRLGSSSPSSRHRRLSHIRTHGIGDHHGTDPSSDIFNVPASPPATSPPFPIISRRTQKSRSRGVSVSSRNPRLSWHDDNENTVSKSRDLLTPATSAIKPVSDIISLHSDSDDPFASPPNASPLASSSDESIQIRKVGRKIRGVLPASHLRLDQHLKKPPAPSRTQRESLTASPPKNLLRRGVALPKPLETGSTTPVLTNNAFSFPPDDWDEDDDNGIARNDFVMEDDDTTELESDFAKPRMGFAEEDDRIDAMLPSGKRHGRGRDIRLRKKRRLGSTSLNIDGTYKRQPKITEHLDMARKSKSSKANSTRRSKYKRNGQPSGTSRPQTQAPPRLSILDTASGARLKELPQFIKIAARTARSKKDQGRQSPAMKYIRLATREDTFDAQSVLQEWNEGKIPQRNLATLHSLKPSRVPLGRISENIQTRLRSPVAKSRPRFHSIHPGKGIPRKLIVLKEQQTMNNYVTTVSPASEERIREQLLPSNSNITRKRSEGPRFSSHQPRPAQLESAELEYSRRHPTAARGSMNKAFESLYRSIRNRPAPQSNLQLKRFLADDDVVWPSIETDHQPTQDSLETMPKVPKCGKRVRRRKRLPQHLDAGAAIYRQPSEPLILELVAAPPHEPSGQDNKLLGLGKFGTRYPINFDVFPLPAGVFFHESTFIGSGRLTAAIQTADIYSSSVLRTCSYFRIGDKEFRWGVWDENVSSEMGLYFDWLVDQLNSQHSLEGGPSGQPTAIDTITSVVDYVQRHLSFTSQESRLHFLTRLLEIICDFSSRIGGNKEDFGNTQSQLRIEIVARCIVLVFQLLQFSRNSLDHSPLIHKFEDLLVDVSCSCVSMLLIRGIDHVRKLCDDLQYLSFRERGIREVQYTSHAWVILIRILDAARIPRKSFWEVTNAQLGKDATTTNDARVMEKIWYTIFSLLPLCDFDGSGVVIREARRTASFDNWWLPQQLLKRIFGLYSLNPRQSPGFNDYCRIFVTRCHFLIVEWGWWNCSGIIGTIFDFFALKSLEHLRNEEVHRSPQFLEELDKESSLALEPEDRCFHIFLKVVAIALKHMGHVGDFRGIRNLVARLLPNHDRQYPKEEDIIERELAALRNHHDLLCTLYWAAPSDQRPPLTLIQDLVNADRSHNAACLINLRAWNQLARFILTTSTTPGSFKPFVAWQSMFLTQLCEQYLQEDANTRRQADLRSASEPISETRLQQQIKVNRKSTMATLRRALMNVSDSITMAKSYSDLFDALDTKIICSLLTSEYSEDCTTDVTSILMLYMDRIDQFCPFSEASENSSSRPAEVDSQLSLDMNLNMDRQILIFPLYEKILPNLFLMTRDILECRLYSDTPLPWFHKLVRCWARLASLATEETLELKHFLPGGSRAVFANRTGSNRANKFWPLFLAEMLRNINLEKFFIKDVFDMYLEWLLVLTVPPIEPIYETDLACQFYKSGSCFILYDSLLVKVYSPLRLLKDAINLMRQIHQDSKKGIFDTPSELIRRQTNMTINANHQDLKGYFSSMLKGVMDSIQCQLESMLPGTSIHNNYLKFSQEIMSQIRSRASNIQPLTCFFTTPSAKYWPEDSDPTLYAAGIVSYSLRLREDEPARVSAELFYYLWRGWRHDLIKGQLRNHIGYVSKGLKHFDFFEFMLTHYVPAALLAGFESECGWIIPRTYLPPVASRIVRLLESRGCNTVCIFRSSVNLLKTIVNGIGAQRLKWEGNIKGVHPMNRGMIAITCQFWISIRPTLQAYAEDYPDQRGDFELVSDTLHSFLDLAASIFNGENGRGQRILQLSATEGPYIKNFTTVALNDINDSWILCPGGIDEAMENAAGWVDIHNTVAGGRVSHRVELDRMWDRTLWEVINVGLPPRHPPGRAEISVSETSMFF